MEQNAQPYRTKDGLEASDHGDLCGAIERLIITTTQSSTQGSGGSRPGRPNRQTQTDPLVQDRNLLREVMEAWMQSSRPGKEKKTSAIQVTPEARLAMRKTYSLVTEAIENEQKRSSPTMNAELSHCITETYKKLTGNGSPLTEDERDRSWLPMTRKSKQSPLSITI